MWPDLPIEFIVLGTPVSFQSDNTRAKEEWKSKVLAAALRVVESGSWAFGETRLAVTMFYFPHARMPGDIDNIVKLTLDSLQPHVFLDDVLVDRLVIQRFDPTGSYSFAEPSRTLAGAMAMKDPVLYIRISQVPLEEIAT